MPKLVPREFVNLPVDPLTYQLLGEMVERMPLTRSQLLDMAINLLVQRERMGLLDVPGREKKPQCAGCQATLRRPDSSGYYQRTDGLLACSPGCVAAIDGQWDKIRNRGLRDS